MENQKTDESHKPIVAVLAVMVVLSMVGTATILYLASMALRWLV
jgi:hypothetical protein